MIRILLPLALVAALILFPLYSETSVGPISGETTTTQTGDFFVAGPIKCFARQKFSTAGACAPPLGMLGMAVFASLIASVMAAVTGVFGLLPIVGRVTSVVTGLSGLVVVGSMVYFILTIMSKGHGVHIEWGAYLNGGLGVLTVLAGLSGIRGK